MDGILLLPVCTTNARLTALRQKRSELEASRTLLSGENWSCARDRHAQQQVQLRNERQTVRQIEQQI